jgi:hypothetical protein
MLHARPSTVSITGAAELDALLGAAASATVSTAEADHLRKTLAMLRNSKS